MDVNEFWFKFVFQSHEQFIAFFDICFGSQYLFNIIFISFTLQSIHYAGFITLYLHLLIKVFHTHFPFYLKSDLFKLSIYLRQFLIWFFLVLVKPFFHWVLLLIQIWYLWLEVAFLFSDLINHWLKSFQLSLYFLFACFLIDQLP